MIRLIDFGAARQALVDKALTTIVTPGYAPIEQYQSDQNQQGAWTDIYSLGATLYRATCGMPPADAIDRSNALAKGSRDPYISSTEIANKDNYSSRLLKAIDHALAFDDKKRPRTIDDWYSEISNDLEFINLDVTTLGLSLVEPGSYIASGEFSNSKSEKFQTKKTFTVS